MDFLDHCAILILSLFMFSAISCNKISTEEKKSEVLSISQDTIVQKNTSYTVVPDLAIDTIEWVHSQDLIQEIEILKKSRKQAKIEFDSLAYHGGIITEGVIISNKFYFTNTGNAPLSIKKAEVSCGCTVPSVPFLDIAPGERGFIGVEFHSVGKSGQQNPIVEVYSNGLPEKNTLTMKVIVVSKTE